MAVIPDLPPAADFFALRETCAGRRGESVPARALCFAKNPGPCCRMPISPA